MRSIRRIGEGGAYTLSVLFTGVVIANAFHQKKQFYPAVVYLTKSNPSLAVLAVQAFVFLILLGKLTRKIFFGTLRPAETEHLIERSWYAVTETCLAFTVFREEFNPSFVCLFTMLFFFKCFHWLAEDRVDYMERSPLLGCLFHMRILGLLASLALVDILFMRRAYHTTITEGASAQLVFGFEYAVLLTIVFTVTVKYLLHCIDLYDENPWENKAVYLLYLELITSGWKFLLYTAFVIIMSKVHTLPLFAIRPLYLTMRSFKKALADVILSRRAIRNMNQLYPDATEDDLRSVDDCIICREPMHAQGGCKKLPCAHIFHASCLRSWFQRQQTCPTCRMEVLNVRPAAAAPPAAAAAAAPVAPVVPPAPAQAPPMFNPWQAIHVGHLPPQPAAQPAAAPGNNAAPPFTPLNPAAFPGAPFPFPANANPGNGDAVGPSPTATNMAPPFFPFMGMMPPPAMPTANLASLTEEQLKQLESSEREGLEARIQWLRDIQTLLDSAVEQMHQYTQVMSVLNSSNIPSTSSNQNSSTNHTPEASTNKSTTATGNENPDLLSKSSGDQTADKSTLRSSNRTPAEPQAIATEDRSIRSGVQETTGSSITSDQYNGARPKTIQTLSSVTSQASTDVSENSGATLSPTAEEVRKRRLERFEQRAED
ncbi:E3 ubiquitin-protein ligase synoviolin B-like [Watersipora subatra]|uniref:E3 ubiquitin-protein ligase synoviolin B-like n=1 Tax=Watersipora subatra TaxID=2589382 RepID=UPI00355B1558